MSSLPIDERLVKQSLSTGPPDGPQILDYVRSHSLWDGLYLATRDSAYSEQWQVHFGHQQYVPDSSGDSSSILLEASRQVTTAGDAFGSQSQDTEDIQRIVKLIANCCATNSHNRRSVLDSGVVKDLMTLLTRDFDPDILIPTLYNVLADIIDYVPGDMNNTLNDQVQTAYLALLAPDTDSSILVLFLEPNVALKCEPSVIEYLTALVEVSARATADFDQAKTQASDQLLTTCLSRLTAVDGGKHLAQHSIQARLDIVRAIIHLADSKSGRIFLASTGYVLDTALMISVEGLHLPLVKANEHDIGTDNTDEDSDLKIVETLQTAMLKLVYEICAMPAFVDPPKYGLARQSLTMIGFYGHRSSYNRALAYVCLYHFVNTDNRAHLLANEGVLRCLFYDLEQATDRAVTHPALGLAVKLAVTRLLRSLLCLAGLMDAVRHLLLASDLGYDIPMNTVTFYELIVKNNPSHVFELVKRRQDGNNILGDICILFRKGHEAICFEVGRLLIECFATLAADVALVNGFQGNRLDEFLTALDLHETSRMMSFMIIQGQDTNPATAQRVWFALGLLTTSELGKSIVLATLRIEGVEQRLRMMMTSHNKSVIDNIKFMMHNLQYNFISDQGVTEDDLDSAMVSMSLR